MTAEEFKLARDKYIELNRNPIAEKMQGDFRRDFKRSVSSSIQKTLGKKNKSLPQDQMLSPREIKDMANKRANEIANNLATLHEPDMVAGGWHDPMPSGIGKSNLNSAIGGSWKGARLNAVDQAARIAIASGQGGAKMNVVLEVARGSG